MEYNMKISDRLQLSLKADTNYYYVGQIPGELYVAEYTNWTYDEVEEIWVGEIIPAHTESVSDSLKKAYWQSFGLHIGFKYSF
jgi:hypothetical protein